MVRLAIYIFLALLVAVALAWWLDAPGEVTINWRGGQYYTSFAAIVFFTAFLLGVALLLQSLWHWVRRDMPLVGENRHLTRQGKGLTFLNQAIVALVGHHGAPVFARHNPPIAQSLQ